MFRGRLCIVLAALLWSLSGLFTNLLTVDTGLGLHEPQLHGLQIAFYRALFACLVLLPGLRLREVTFRRPMVFMMACFAIMNALFVMAMKEGKAANAIFLQYTAPMWMYLASVWWLGEPPDRRSSGTIAIGLVGIGFIVWGGRQDAQLPVVAIALGSGVTYAGVVLALRVLRHESSRYLIVLNHLCSALLLLPIVWVVAPTVPTGGQLGVLFLFGAVQMGLPYLLMARGLRTVSAQEAGVITLLEPLLNPVWAYLIAPVKEAPSLFTLLGGACILGGLAWRYWPRPLKV
jgi:drug/metabolite transporter (DMT)-like permease